MLADNFTLVRIEGLTGLTQSGSSLISDVLHCALYCPCVILYVGAQMYGGYQSPYALSRHSTVDNPH